MKKILLMIPCMVLALLVLFPVKAEAFEYNGTEYATVTSFNYYMGYGTLDLHRHEIYSTNPDATILVIVSLFKRDDGTYGYPAWLVSVGGDTEITVFRNGTCVVEKQLVQEVNMDALNARLLNKLGEGGGYHAETGIYALIGYMGFYDPTSGSPAPYVSDISGYLTEIPYDDSVGNPTWRHVKNAVENMDEFVHRAEADDPGFKLIDFLTTIEYFDGENWYFDGEGESGGGASRGDSESDGGASRGGPCVKISSSWSGTTYDYRTDLDLTDSYVRLDAGYVEADTGKNPTEEDLDFQVLISEKKMTSECIDFFSSDETQRLRYLKFTPVYQTSHVRCYGTPRYVYLTDTGSIDESELHGDYIQDYSLKLTDVHLSDDMLGAKKSISWTGTSKDDVISSVPTDRKLVAVVVETKNSDGEYRYYAGKNFVQILNQGSYEAPVFSHLTVDMFTTTDKTEHLPRYVPLNSYQLNVYWELVDAVYSAKDLELTGRLFLFPAYFSKNRGDIVSGAVTCVDIVNEKIEQVDEDEDGNPVTNPIDDDDSVPLPDLDLDDMDLSSFWDVIQNIVNSMGRVPYIFAAIFPFLPDWVCYLISFSIVALVFLRFLGR